MPAEPSDHPTNDAPAPPPVAPDTANAADLIREKVARIYEEEPGTALEVAEAKNSQPPRSKHQQFMYELSTSGKDLASIQTEWHEYYQNLSPREKHQVWQEFYDSQSRVIRSPGITPTAEAQKLAEHKRQVARPERSSSAPKRAAKLRDARNRAKVQTAIRDKVSAGGKLQGKHHLQSLLFGLSLGSLVILVFLFGFFNEVFIAPFIQPSRVAAATPLIVSSSSVAPTATPEVIIPKINVEIPVDYSETTTDEAAIENDLQNGVVHYPITALPGQLGNTAFFGHSSNNIFNKGKYKFAFVLLHTLVNGDTFYLTYNSKVYVYKVISRSIVDPSDVGVLGPIAGQSATATLITCDPPGTSLHRLVVVGQQISPDPSSDTQANSISTSNATPAALPSDGPTLWARFSSTLFGKLIAIAAVAIIVWLVVCWVNQPKRLLQSR